MPWPRLRSNPQFISSYDKTLARTTLIFDTYHRLWESGIIATDLYGRFNGKDTPWILREQLGGSTPHARLLRGAVYRQQHSLMSGRAAATYLQTYRGNRMGRLRNSLPQLPRVQTGATCCQRTAWGFAGSSSIASTYVSTTASANIQAASSSTSTRRSDHWRRLQEKTIVCGHCACERFFHTCKIQP